jgi:hypothetical protein
MVSAPCSPQDYGDGPADDAALEADGWAAGLAVWGSVTKAYANFTGDGALANSQLWSLREAVRREVLAEAGAGLTDRERQAVEECFAEVRAMWDLLLPVLQPLLAEARRQENWRIAKSVAARIVDRG